MAWLNLYVRYPGGVYHGLEWPPSPFKLMQAMIAGFNQGRDRSLPDANFEAAIRWLEQQSPPWVDVPDSDKGIVLTVAVPNNEDNLALAAWATGKPESANARAKRNALKEMPQQFLQQDKPLSYHWQFAVADEAIARRITGYAHRITALGRGIDMVVAWGEVSAEAPVVSAQCYLPQHSGVALRVPVAGSFAALEARYQAQFQPRSGNVWVVGLPSLHYGTARYHRADQPAGKPYIAFEFLSLNGRGYWARDARQGDEVCAMVRHQVCNALTAELGEPEAVAQWLGHGDPNGERLQILPLPSIGHEHVDGLIRRVMVTGSDADLLERLAWALEGGELLKDGKPVARLARLFGEDPMIARYTAISAQKKSVVGALEWVSVTPVVLPGFDHQGKRTARLMHKALQQAGLPEPVTMAVSSAPHQRHGYRAGSYAVPDYLSKYPQYHVQIRWEKPQLGPIVIGAGRFRGLGLFYPVAARTGSDDENAGGFAESSNPLV